MTEHQGYPLEWPVGQPRTPRLRRRASLFKRLHLGDARDQLKAELGRLGARHVVISTDIPLRLDGEFYASHRQPDDPGVAVYFLRRGKPYSIACDTYRKLSENVRAIHATIEALRKIERHGASDLLEQALSGFKALPAAIVVRPKWWQTLGFEHEPIEDEQTLRVAETRWRTLLRKEHPDRGGDSGRAALLNDAISEARQIMGGE